MRQRPKRPCSDCMGENLSLTEENGQVWMVCTKCFIAGSRAEVNGAESQLTKVMLARTAWFTR